MRKMTIMKINKITNDLLKKFKEIHLKPKIKEKVNNQK